MFKTVNIARAQSVKAYLFKEDKIFASYDSKCRVWNFVVLKTPVLVEIDFNFDVLAADKFSEEVLCLLHTSCCQSRFRCCCLGQIRVKVKKC